MCRRFLQICQKCRSQSKGNEALTDTLSVATCHIIERKPLHVHRYRIERNVRSIVNRNEIYWFVLQLFLALKLICFSFISMQLDKTLLVNCNFLSCVDGPHKTPAAMSSNTNTHNILSNFIHAMNHTSLNSMTSSGDAASMGLCSSANRQQPLLQGTFYKWHKKNGKKEKYFVIFDDAPEKPGTARLEYFETEKKFRTAMSKSTDNGITSQKRSIILCECFNINRRIDTPKYKYVIGLYRKDDTFSIIMKDEKVMNEWLKQLLILQRGKELLDGDQPRPTFGKSTFFNNLCVTKSILIGSEAKSCVVFMTRQGLHNDSKSSNPPGAAM